LPTVIPSGFVVSATLLWRLTRGVAPGVLTALALFGFLLSVACVHHTHTAEGVGFYNQEHDLSFLAAFGGGAPPPDAAPAAPLQAPVTGVVILAAARVGSAPRRLARPRAPPAR
jgi:hypothetical protein